MLKSRRFPEIKTVFYTIESCHVKQPRNNSVMKLQCIML